MNILNGIQVFLQFINDQWTTIMVLVGLMLAVGKKVKDYISKSNDEKIGIAKAQIQETILKMVTEAEVDYEEWNKAGSIKRSQVITQIYEEYPVLSKITDQKSLIEWVDTTIDESLKTLREIVAGNTKEASSAE